MARCPTINDGRSQSAGNGSVNSTRIGTFTNRRAVCVRRRWNRRQHGVMWRLIKQTTVRVARQEPADAVIINALRNQSRLKLAPRNTNKHGKRTIRVQRFPEFFRVCSCSSVKKLRLQFELVPGADCPHPCWFTFNSEDKVRQTKAIEVPTCYCHGEPGAMRHHVDLMRRDRQSQFILAATFCEPKLSLVAF